MSSPTQDSEAIGARVAQNTANYDKWKRGPFGLQAMGFHRVSKPDPALPPSDVKTKLQRPAR